MPVVYSELEWRIVSELGAQKPRLALSIAVAPGRNRVTPEKIAINLKHPTDPDNSGKILQGDQIDPNEPDGTFTNLPIENLVKRAHYFHRSKNQEERPIIHE